ncbi:MAG: hypothetical protein JNM66_23060 [Bryobacterales bacterium]|nr:hypothetical protein [Bryobacterales bacterium]
MRPILLLATLASLAAAELRFSIRSDPKTLEPLAVTDQNSDTVRFLTTARLVRRNRITQKLEAELAEKWEIRDKGLTLVFRLRPGLRYSDGTVADSQDVKTTIQRLLDPAKAYPMSEGLRAAGITSVETPGPLEVRIRTKEPIAGLDSFFEEVPVLSSRSPLGDKAALGPFVLTEYKRGTSLRFQKNPNYFRKPLPRLDAVRIDIQANPELERARFERGELHFLSALDADGFAALQKTGQTQDAGPTLDSEILWFNQNPGAPIPEHKKKWFTSREFRCALSAALHREDLVRVAYGGRAVPGVGPVAPSAKEWFAPKLRAQPYDAKQTQTLLTRAGFQLRNGLLLDSSGNPVTFSLLTNSTSRVRQRMAAMIQQDLDKIGIKIQVVLLDMPSLLERMTRSSNYDAVLLGMVGIDLDPNDQMNIWMSTSSSHAWNPSQKQPATPWEAEIDQVLRAQFHATSPAKRRQFMQRFQEIVADQAPVLYLVHPNALAAVSRQLTGVKVSSLLPRVIWNIEEVGLAPAETAR